MKGSTYIIQGKKCFYNCLKNFSLLNFNNNNSNSNNTKYAEMKTPPNSQANSKWTIKIQTKPNKKNDKNQKQFLGAMINKEKKLK